MNGSIKEFLAHRETCPICSHKLTTVLNSKSSAFNRVEDGRYLCFRRLKDLYSKAPSYWVAYAFGPDDSFDIEFYDNCIDKLDSINLNLVKKFWYLHNNLSVSIFRYKLIRYCNSCGAYNYQSTDFDFDFRTSKVKPFVVGKEFIGLYKKTNDSKYKIYKLVNNLGNSISTINYITTKDNPNFNKHNLITSWYFRGGIIDVPYIEFTDKESMIDKLDLLITFS